MTELASLVFKILSGIPVSIVDTDTNDTWESGIWELVVPRITGDYAGSREVGSANMVAAYNIILQKTGELENAYEAFLSVITELETNKKIRKKPYRLRESFRVV